MALKRLTPLCLGIPVIFNPDGICPSFVSLSHCHVTSAQAFFFFFFLQELGAEWDHSSFWAAGGTLSSFFKTEVTAHLHVAT